MLRAKLYLISILLACLLLTGCSAPYIITVWKNEHAFPGKYNKIMVTAIVNINDTILRAKLENHFKEGLESIGYHAVSSLAEFGTKGLHELGQEATYIGLCNKGIDAVITVALTDSPSEIFPESRIAYTYPANYYYEHMWHYRERQLQLPPDSYDSVMKYSWEMILFDLSTLQPHYIAQTRPTTGAIRQSIDHEFWKALIKKMTKEKYLKKNPAIITGPKAF
jgi:hypothetical protein